MGSPMDFLSASILGCVAGAVAESKMWELLSKKDSTSVMDCFGFSPNNKLQTMVICKVCADTVRILDGISVNGTHC